MSEFATPLKTVKTRKSHICCCYERFCDSGYGLEDVPDQFHGAIARMRETKGVIPIGSECYFWSGKYDGEMYTAYADKEMHDLICEMQWFDN